MLKGRFAGAGWSRAKLEMSVAVNARVISVAATINRRAFCV
jgi:hypothetical protein